MDLSAINPILLLASLMVAATPILLAAIGELVVERAGVLNLGVEGMMITGAVCGFIVAVGTASPGRLTVPAAAVLRRGELTAVYAAQDSRFVLKAVRLGAAAGTGVEVLAGLKAGERIALDPVRAGLAGAVAPAQ